MPDGRGIDDALSERQEVSRAPAATVAATTPAGVTRSVAAPSHRTRRSGRRVTLHLSHAPLGEVLRLLASEARVGIVLATSLDQPVSLDVSAADPLDVLDALASAHRLEIERQHGLLVVRRAGAP